MIPRDKLRKAAPLVKAACDHRYRMNVCKALLVKSAQEVEEKEEKKPDYDKRRKVLKLILGSLAGAGFGGAIGAQNEGGGAGALAGAAIGGLAGAGAAHAHSKIREFFGLDPTLYTLALKKSAASTGLSVGKAHLGVGAKKDILGNYNAGMWAVSPSGGATLAGSASPKMLRNAAIGAGAGALAGLIREKFKGEDKKKKYLKSLLLGAIYGGGAGAAGTMIFNSPDYSKKMKGLLNGKK